MSKKFWIVVIVIVIVLIGIFSLTGPKNKTTTTGKPTDHVIGLGKDGISLVEYGDYQCPYCGQYYSTVQQIQQIYNTQMTYQFVNFPLTSIHPNAFAGARAAEAAGLMGKYWQMHDLLYTQNQEYYNSNGAYAGWIGTTNPLPVFDQDAKSLGLNVSKFNQYYASDQVNNMIIADENKGNALNINGTPTFFLDGKEVQLADSVSAFEKVINAAIAAKTGNGTKTVPTSAGSTSQSKGTTK